MPNITVEICCGSADDVFRAKAAGAHRVELNAALFLGGLTPSIGALALAREADLGIMAMVRPRGGGFCYTERETQTMLLDAQELLDCGADGIVFGFLHEDGRVDQERCRKMMKVIGTKTSVFHRAIDVTPNWRDALDALMDLKINRVLTSGQAATALEGMDTVKEMRAYVAGRIEILPGAGIRANNVKALLTHTGCDQVHASMSSLRPDISTMGNPAIHFSGSQLPPEDSFSMADAARIRQFIDAVNV